MLMMLVILSGAPLREAKGAESKDPVQFQVDGILRLRFAPLRMTLLSYGCVTR
jgi:hypothetical protein